MVNYKGVYLSPQDSSYLAIDPQYLLHMPLFITMLVRILATFKQQIMVTKNTLEKLKFIVIFLLPRYENIHM